MSSGESMTADLPQEIEDSFRALKLAARELRQLPTAIKNKALLAIASKLLNSSAEILAANAIDVAALPSDTTSSFRDRLILNPVRLEAMSESLRQVAALADPVGEVVTRKTIESGSGKGLKLTQVRAPLGVIFMIFESRPNVITEAFSLAFKSGNAIALRGGSDSKNTAQILYALIREALSENNINTHVVYGMNDYNRAWVSLLLRRPELIDVAVPRGGEKLIEFVARTALMSVLKHDRGLCHAYVDEFLPTDVDLQMAVKVVANAKTQRPGVCNSLETVLVHSKVAAQFLPQLFEATRSVALDWRCDDLSLALLKNPASAHLASELDWDTEHLEQILNCRVVQSMDEAIEHIEKHGSRHSETILTRSEANARRFQNEVDAAAVYWNASTRFTDGFEFGLGGELGISTQKLHVRGPVGVRELTTPRWIIDGDGQVRG